MWVLPLVKFVVVSTSTFRKSLSMQRVDDDLPSEVEHLSASFGVAMDWESVLALVAKHGVSLEMES